MITEETLLIEHLKRDRCSTQKDKTPQRICQGNFVLMTFTIFSAQTLAAIRILRNPTSSKKTLLQTTVSALEDVRFHPHYMISDWSLLAFTVSRECGCHDRGVLCEGHRCHLRHTLIRFGWLSAEEPARLLRWWGKVGMRSGSQGRGFSLK